MVMKTHAFVRSNVPRVLNSSQKTDDSPKVKAANCPEFSKYLYFMFAPTLIYRDNYPRYYSIRLHFMYFILINIKFKI
jgi:sterol O-acyltransferase